MKSIKDLSMSELINLIKVPIDNNNYNKFLQKMSHYLPEERIADFKKNHVNSSVLKVSTIEKFLIDNEKDVDKEAFVLIMLYFYKQRSNITTNKKLDEQNIKNAQTLLAKSTKKILDIEEKNNLIGKIRVITFKSLVEGKEKSNFEKLKAIDEDLNLDYILSNLQLTDLGDIICDDEEIGDILRTKVIWNSFIKHRGKTIDELIDMDRTEEPEYIKEFATMPFEEYRDELRNEIFENSGLINVEKLLLVVGFRLRNHLEENDVNEEICDYIKMIMEGIQRNLNNTNIRIKGKITLKDAEDTMSILYSFKDLKDDLQKFEGSKYFGKCTQEKFKKELLEGNIELEGLSQREFKLLNLSQEEIKQICTQNEANIKFAIQTGIIEKDNVIELLGTQTKYSNEFISLLYNQELLDNDAMLELYMKQAVSLENIKHIKEEGNNNISNIITPEKMCSLYMNYVWGVYTFGTMEEYEKQKLLYQSLYINGKTKEEVIEKADDLLSEFRLDSLTEENLKELYHQGLIPLDTAISMGGQSIASKMFQEKLLKPSDVKYLLGEGQLNIEGFKKILNSNISEGEKLTLIYSTFDTDEDKQIRDELVQLINIEKAKTQKNEGQVRKKRDIQNEGKKYETDPYTRWKLIRLLDKEYQQEDLTKDGYMIFHLPNQKNGIVIIEKFFDKTSNELEPSYGSATYVLKEEDFLNNRKQIIKDGLIQKSELLDLKDRKMAKKFNHVDSWGRSIKDYFEVGVDESKYSAEEQQQIDSAIAEIKRSRKLREYGE